MKKIKGLLLIVFLFFACDFVVERVMKHGVDGQVTNLPLDGVAELLRLGAGALQGDDHIAQGDGIGAGIHVILPVTGGIAGLTLEHGEREHIRGTVDIPCGLVDAVDANIICDENVDLAQGGDALGIQSRLHTALDVPGHGDI